MADMLSREEQNKILDALNERSLPFDRYKFKWDKEHKNFVRLGGGGFGNVYACEGRVENDVAIKVIGFQIPTIKDPDEVDGCDEEVWIQREVSATCKEIVQIRDAQWLRIDLDDDWNVKNAVSLEEPKVVGDDSGLFLFILMERLEPILSSDQKGNKVLFSRLQNTNENEIIKLAIDIGRALKAAHTHSSKIIHRDVKLDNVFWDERLGVYKLGDFGIARATTEGGSMTRGSGTRLYIAPEVFLGKDYDVKADMYSFGIMLYGLLNERKLPNVETRMKQKTPLPLPKYGSEELQTIVLKTCSYKPEDRYGSMDEVLKELEKLQKQERYQNTINLKPSKSIEECLEEELGSITVSLKTMAKSEKRAQIELSDLDVDLTRNDQEEIIDLNLTQREARKTKKEVPEQQPSAKKEAPVQQPAAKKAAPEQQPSAKKKAPVQQPAAKKDTKELMAEVDRYLANQKEKEKNQKKVAPRNACGSVGNFFHMCVKLITGTATAIGYTITICVSLLWPILPMGGVLWGAAYLMEPFKVPPEWYWVGGLCGILLYLAIIRRLLGEGIMGRLNGKMVQRLSYILLILIGALTWIESIPIPWPEVVLQWELLRIGLISLVVCESYNLIQK